MSSSLAFAHTRSARPWPMTAAEVAGVRALGAAVLLVTAASLAVGVVLAYQQPLDWCPSSIVVAALLLSSVGPCVIGALLLRGGRTATNHAGAWAEWLLRPFGDSLCLSNLVVGSGDPDLSPTTRAWWWIGGVAVGGAVAGVAAAGGLVTIPAVALALVGPGLVPAVVVLRLDAVFEGIARREAKLRCGARLAPRMSS